MLIRPQNSSLPDTPANRLREVRARIAMAAQLARRSEECITLVAVSKGHGAAEVTALAQLGVEHFAESYLQEAVPKMESLAGLELTWHFIGRVQANKTRLIAERFAWVHGLDRLRVAERLAAQRPPFAPPLNVCIQVKMSEDATKGGADAKEAVRLAKDLAGLPRLRLRGLMCMLPDGLDAGSQLSQFRDVHALFERLKCAGAALDTLSMGMSGDFEAAIASGATLVRLGTALFGSRTSP